MAKQQRQTKRKGNLDKVGRDPKTGRFVKVDAKTNPIEPIGPKPTVQPKSKKEVVKPLPDNDLGKMVADVLDDLGKQ